VIGGGPAGLLAALSAARAGAGVILAEKNKETGRKLRITGKGRCNVTNIGDTRSFVRNYGGQGRFLYSAFSRFFNQDIRSLLDEAGVPTKEERGGRVFPVSDRALDVAAALEKLVADVGVKVIKNCRVQGLIIDDSEVSGALVYDPWDSSRISARAVIIATGGASYPLTGSTGDGYAWVKDAGHRVVDIKPALIPLVSPDPWVWGLSGLTLKNVGVSLWKTEADGDSTGIVKLDDLRGELLFAHFGVTGPVVLSMSRNLEIEEKGSAWISIDMKPALSHEVLDNRIVRDFQTHNRKLLAGGMIDLLPKAMIEPVIAQTGMDTGQRVSAVTKAQRQKLVETLKGLIVNISGTRPLEEALVTAGGVSLSEIDPKTMESKLVRGLYFAGEIMDIDGLTGGYNLQAAFSTGWVAGESAALSGADRGMLTI